MPIHKRFDRLPAEYQEVEYIESTGTQWIDSGVSPIVSSEISTVFSLGQNIASSGSDNMIFGCRKDAKRFWLDADFDYSVHQLKYGFGTDRPTPFEPQIDNLTKVFSLTVNWTTIKADIVCEYDGRSFYQGSINGDITGVTNNIIVLAAKDENDIKFFARAKLFSMNIKQNSTLIRSFVPCYRKSDNVVGLYDLVTKAFFVNQGTGEFLKGASVYPTPKIAAIYKGDVKIGKVYKGNTLIYSSRALPSAYQEVEYIESTGTQWIDTGFMSSQYTKLIAKARLITGVLQAGLYINQHGSGRGGSIDDRFLFGAMFQSGQTDKVIFGLGTQQNLTYSNLQDTIHTFTIDAINKQCQIDSDIFGGFTGISSSSLSIYLFGRHLRLDDPSPDFLGASSAIYFCKIYENSHLARDFVPCYRKADSKPGLYDLVTKQFFVNQGTGSDFLLGPDKSLPSEYQKVEYIESTGTQWIDIGYIGNNTGYDVTLDFLYTSPIEHNENLIGIYGYYSGDPDTRNIIRIATGDNNIQLFSTNYSGLLAGPIAEPNVKYSIYAKFQNAPVLKVDNTEYTNDSEYRRLTKSLYLFNVHSSLSPEGEVNLNASYIGRLYFCQILESGTRVRDFIPCYRKSDNEIGLYDLMTHAFFTNQGTGTFIKGPDVN